MHATAAAGASVNLLRAPPFPFWQVCGQQDARERVCSSIGGSRCREWLGWPVSKSVAGRPAEFDHGVLPWSNLPTHESDDCSAAAATAWAEGEPAVVIAAAAATEVARAAAPARLPCSPQR